jgi:hypothetical protein
MLDRILYMPAEAAPKNGTTSPARELGRFERNRMPAVGNGKEMIRVCP